MSLRRQLILVALISLVLPWAAWQYLTELEQFLRRGEERALTATAAAIAAGVAAGPPRELSGEGGAAALYVRPGARVVVDGYEDDWQPWLRWAQPLQTGSEPVARLTLAEDAQALYLLLLVDDRQVVYESPALGDPERSDHVLIDLERDGRQYRFRLTNLAPGWVEARPLQPLEVEPLRGEWQDVPGGYSIELRIPRALVGERLGLTLVDVDDPVDREVVGRHETALRPLIRPSAATLEQLAALAPEGVRVWLVDQAGWVLGRSGNPYRRADQQTQGRWLRNLVYRYLIRPPLEAAPVRQDEALRLEGAELAAALAGRPAVVWQAAGEEDTVVGAAAHPLRVDGRLRGAVVVEQASDSLLLFTNRALGRLLVLTGGALLLVVAVLLGFATLLSWRIRRLRDAAESALGPDGRVRPFKPSPRSDELGDLSRAVARSLGNLRDYTDYLKTLAGKLSHELRTPLAVVSSSLDNLQQQPLPAEAEPYMRRAREGSERLARILRAMSEAQRIEQSLRSEDPEPFDLAELVTVCAEGYRDLSPEHRLQVEIAAGDYRLTGMPELVVQLLDKLVDNAFGFAPAGAQVWLSLRPVDAGLELAVANEGPTLPARMQDRLFDSMVSLRAQQQDGPHLGLGLYIVRLIAELHGGQVDAQDLPAGDGVEFRVLLRDVRQQAPVREPAPAV